VVQGLVFGGFGFWEDWIGKGSEILGTFLLGN